MPDVWSKVNRKPQEQMQRKKEEFSMSTSKKQELQWWQKYTLTLNEAAEYFGIGDLT